MDSEIVLKTRKERHKSFTINYLRLIEVSSFLLFSFLIAIFDMKLGITVLIFFSPFILQEFKKQNIIGISLLFFFLQPTVLSMVIASVLLMISGNNTYIFYLTLLLIPLISLVSLFLERKNSQFLSKAKVSLELNNYIFTLITLLTVFIAYQRNDYIFLSELFDFNELKKDGFQPRDAFNFLSVLFTLPYLLSTGLCKVYVEFYSYTKNK